MSGRTTGIGNLFKKIDPYGRQTADAGQVDVAAYHIDTIFPDPDQPRRFLTPDLYEQLFSGQATPAAVLTQWLQHPGSVAHKQAVEALQQLAVTIAQHGLVNPIMIREVDPQSVPEGVQYMIVTGERRWWAHVLLTMQEKSIGPRKEYPDRIKAIFLEEGVSVRAVQLIENMARDDLSAIERAEGMLALREELSPPEGKKITWKKVEEALGLSRSYRTRILNVLKLSDEARALVEQYDLNEKAIRPITDKLLSQPDLQLVALKQLIRWQEADEPYGYKRLATYVNRLLQPEEIKDQDDSFSRMQSTLRKQLDRTVKAFDKLDPQYIPQIAESFSDNEDARATLRRLRGHIDALLDEF